MGVWGEVEEGNWLWGHKTKWSKLSGILHLDTKVTWKVPRTIKCREKMSQWMWQRRVMKSNEKRHWVLVSGLVSKMQLLFLCLFVCFNKRMKKQRSGNSMGSKEDSKRNNWSQLPWEGTRIHSKYVWIETFVILIICRIIKRNIRSVSGCKSSLMGKRISQMVWLPQGMQGQAKSTPTAVCTVQPKEKNHRTHTWLPGPTPMVWEQCSNKWGMNYKLGRLMFILS